MINTDFSNLLARLGTLNMEQKQQLLAALSILEVTPSKTDIISEDYTYIKIFNKISSLDIDDYNKFIYKTNEQIDTIKSSEYLVKKMINNIDYDIKYNIKIYSIDEFDLNDPQFYFYDNNFRYDILSLPKKSKNLFVIFSGSLHGTTGILPIFKRGSWSSIIPASVICIADPMLYKYSIQNLQLGWYYGTKDISCIERISVFIKNVQKKLNISNNNTIFFGSSGGGT